MSFVREPIWVALFERLSAVSAVKTKERRLRHWNDVPGREQPYLCLAQGPETPSYETGRTTQYTLHGSIWIYAQSERGVPGTVLNPILDGITAVFQFDNTMMNAFTIGGLVMWCRMGPSETDEGTLGSQSVVRIPIEMLAWG